MKRCVCGAEAAQYQAICWECRRSFPQALGWPQCDPALTYEIRSVERYAITAAGDLVAHPPAWWDAMAQTDGRFE